MKGKITMKHTNNDLSISTNKALDSIAEIKFYIHRYLETKNSQCLKMARQETKTIRKIIFDVLENEELDEDLKRKADAEETFLPLLETINGLEDFLEECGIEQ